MILTSSNYCKSCKFYKPLYVKDNTRFKTLTGYCFNSDLNKRNKQKIDPCMDNCEFWAQREDKTAEQKESIREAIFDMRKRLTQILEILENED